MKTITSTATKQRMNPHQLLLSARKQLLTGFGDKADTLRRPENVALEDMAPVFHDQFVASLLNQLDFERLQLINEAIERVKSGVYGICSECEESIAQKRLQAIPWAVRCVTCEAAWTPVRQVEEFGEELAA
jgi:DnaK suppressor protein